MLEILARRLDSTAEALVRWDAELELREAMHTHANSQMLLAEKQQQQQQQQGEAERFATGGDAGVALVTAAMREAVAVD